MNPDLPSRHRDSSQDQPSGDEGGMNFPATVRCHQCGGEAHVPSQRIDPSAPTGQTQGYDQHDRHEGYLIDIECPNCGHVKQRLTADDA